MGKNSAWSTADLTSLAAIPMDAINDEDCFLKLVRDDSNSSNLPAIYLWRKASNTWVKLEAVVTADDTLTTPTNTGTLTQLASWFAGRIKAITGKASWLTAPAITLEDANTAIALKANALNAALTGVPTAPTATLNTNTTQLANCLFVLNQIAALVNSSPTALDTLNELAAALGNDANFATTITNALALKAPLASPTFTGTVGGITSTMVGLGNLTDFLQVNTTQNQTGIGGNKTFTGLVTFSNTATATSTTTGTTFAGGIGVAGSGHFGIGIYSPNAWLREPPSGVTIINANSLTFNQFAATKWIDGSVTNLNLPVNAGMIHQFDPLFGTGAANLYRQQEFSDTGGRVWKRAESNGTWGAWKEISFI